MAATTALKAAMPPCRGVAPLSNLWLPTFRPISSRPRLLSLWPAAAAKRPTDSNSAASLEVLQAELDVARQEAGAAERLRAELDARAAAMANLQAQLEHVELLREEELKTASGRFEELESALSMAERSIEGEAERAGSLEAQVEALTADLNRAKEELARAQQAQRDAVEAAQAAQGQLREAQAVAEGARKEAAEANSRAEDLRRMASDEAAAAAELLQKAEEAAEAIGQFLAVTEEDAASELNDERQIPAHSEGSGVAAQPGMSAGGLSEADAEILLDELDLLRGELEAELMASEAALARAEGAEAEAEALRKQLAHLASAGDDGAAAMGGFSQTLVQELAAARAAAAASAAEVESLRVTAAALESELATVKSAKNGVAGAGEGGRVAALEAANAELRAEAMRREAALAEGRAFLEAVLQQHSQVKSAGGAAKESSVA